jgi:integrase
MKPNSGKNSKRCAVRIANEKMEPSRQISIVPKRNKNYLTEKELVDYQEYRKTFLYYLLKMGKNPKKAEGYSPYSVYATSNRLARFDYWTWKENDGYKTPPTEQEAQSYMEEVAFRDVTEGTKGKILEALLRYSKWLKHHYGQEPWEFEWNFSSSGSNSGPRDFLTKDERHKIRRAALHMGNGWKFTSIIWTALDAALRPVEVGRAKTSWVDIGNGILRIPREESSKNEGDWRVGLTDRTVSALEKWLEERAESARYDATDRLWLTRRSNRYGGRELSRLLRKLCDDADIGYENRQMSFYAIRHSTGTYMTKERDLAAAKAQLRHKSVKTTMKYDQVPVEDRREALDKMG